jgi:hypothetical protein
MALDLMRENAVAQMAGVKLALSIVLAHPKGVLHAMIEPRCFVT